MGDRMPLKGVPKQLNLNDGNMNALVTAARVLGVTEDEVLNRCVASAFNLGQALHGMMFFAGYWQRAEMAAAKAGPDPDAAKPTEDLTTDSPEERLKKARIAAGLEPS